MSLPTTLPLTRNSTWVTATLSLASALIVTEPLTVAASAGAVRLTDGVVSGGGEPLLSMVTLWALLVVVLLPSLARAVIVAGPLARLVESQLML